MTDKNTNGEPFPDREGAFGTGDDDQRTDLDRGLAGEDGRDAGPTAVPGGPRDAGPGAVPGGPGTGPGGGPDAGPGARPAGPEDVGPGAFPRGRGRRPGTGPEEPEPDLGGPGATPEPEGPQAEGGPGGSPAGPAGPAGEGVGAGAEEGAGEGAGGADEAAGGAEERAGEGADGKEGRNGGREAGAATGGEAETWEAAEVAERIAALEDRWLRAAAELDNLRKRVSRDVDRHRAQERARVASEWLPVVDHLDLALQHSDTGSEAMVAGIRAVRDQAVAVLDRLGYPRHDEVGVPFDPNLHDAVSAVPGVDAAPGTVMEVVRPGYGHGDRQLRPAMVIVAARPEQGDAEGDGSAGGKAG